MGVVNAAQRTQLPMVLGQQLVCALQIITKITLMKSAEVCLSDLIYEMCEIIFPKSDVILMLIFCEFLTEIPPKPKNLNYTILQDNKIRLHWDMVVEHGVIYYRVKCEKQKFGGNLLPCTDLPMYKKGMNITKRNLTVSGLANDKHYMFSVTSINDVSAKAGESQWKSAKIVVKLPGD